MFFGAILYVKFNGFLIRSLENLALLDELLHRCVYDRRVSGLQDITELKKSHESGEISLKEIKVIHMCFLKLIHAGIRQ